MAERVELKEARRRDVIYLPGDPGKALYFVHGGRIKVSKVTRDGKSLTLAYHGPAELFGDSCLLGGGPSSRTRSRRSSSATSRASSPSCSSSSPASTASKTRAARSSRSRSPTK